MMSQLARLISYEQQLAMSAQSCCPMILLPKTESNVIKVSSAKLPFGFFYVGHVDDISCEQREYIITLAC